jgi:hypothetical protein
MIPKVIHYCWFGGTTFSQFAKKCIESWKVYCPDYEIKEWNEKTFDMNFCDFAAEASNRQNWAFVSDVARLYAVYNEGGVYLDTDVEIIKPFDDLLDTQMFIGFEDDRLLNTGQGFGAVKGHPLVKKMLDMYTSMGFNTNPCPVYNTEAIKKEGFILNNTYQKQKGVTLYPTDYFCPKDRRTGKVCITDNTYSIHHFDASWLSDEEKREKDLLINYRSLYGNRLGVLLYTFFAFCTLRKSGIRYVIKRI